MSGYPSNTQNSNGAYTGDAYAIDTSGGFSIEQSFPEIQLQDTTVANKFDVTDALQIQYSVRRMNDRIGITKDEVNDKTLFLEFDASNDMLVNDTVTITSQDILSYITSENIISFADFSRN